MPGVVLFSGLCAVVYFVVGIRFDQVFIADTPTPIGEFAVLSMVLLSAAGMVWVYKKKWEPVSRCKIISIIGNRIRKTIIQIFFQFFMVNE